MLLLPGQPWPDPGKCLNLETCNGTPIPNNRPNEEWSVEKLREGNRLIAGAMQGKTDFELRRLSALYNCMGMVFASRRTDINLNQLTLILQDDGYQQVISREMVVSGDVVVYCDDGKPMHVGLVVHVHRDYSPPIPRVLSKWGQHGEYLHHIDHVPSSYGQATQFWTDREYQ